ncbi:hypothetical protein L6274_01835 [Candidatus Parcubacteria bacterium]|nr:hypothetical protein [Candidatus Parcubacteria bacterium]
MIKYPKYILILTAILISGFLGSQVNAQEISETEITFGSEYVFNIASTSAISLAHLSSSKVIIAYNNGGGNFNQGASVVANISDNTISYGSEYVFNTASADYVSVKMLSEDKAIMVYQDSGNSNYGTVVIANISGNTITFGSEYVFNTSLTEHTSATILSENKFVIVYQDSEGGYKQGKAVVGEVSGSEITFGSEYVFNGAGIDYVSAKMLSENKFAITYQDVGNNKYGAAVIANVSDTEITFGLEYVFNPTMTNYISADSLSDSKFAIVYQDYGNNQYGAAVIANISDTEITFGLEYVFNPGNTGIIFTQAISQSKFFVAYQDKMNNLNYGAAIIGSIPVEEIVEPEPEPEIITMDDGDLIRNPNAEDSTKFDIYIVKIVGVKKFKRLILSPSVFESYGHLKWENVQDVSQATMDEYIISNLVRVEGDEKVYQLFPSGDTGTKEIMNQGYDSDSIYTVNSIDINSYE